MNKTAVIGNRLAPALFAIVLAACGGLRSATALPEDLILERFGQERGFPSETITALYRDRAGFLWVGSREGLAVWDGYSVRVFEHAVGSPDSLPDNSIRIIYQDRSDQLWVGTNTGGLARLDRATGRFESFRHDPADPTSLSHDSVYAICEDSEGYLWVGTQDGLNRFDPRTRTFDRLIADRSDPGTIPHNYVYALKLDRLGRVWVATVGGGVAWIDPATRRVTRVPLAPDAGVSDQDRLMFAVAEDPKGDLWFGSERNLFRLAASEGVLHRVALPEIEASQSDPIITSIAIDARGTLWISTWNRGLVAYDPAGGASHGYRHDPERAEGLAADRLSIVFADSADDLWIGTWGSGINRFNTGGDLFRAILERRTGSDGGLPYREVTSVFEDRRGNLWVGTWGRGLCRRDLAAKGFVAVAPPPEPSLALNTVLALAEQPDGTVWAGSTTGLIRIDLRSGNVIPSPRAPRDPHGLGPGYVDALLVDRSGTLWVGTGEGGVNRLEPDGRTFAHFVNNPADANSLSDNYVTTLLEASDGKLWVGTRSGGLNAFDRASGRWLRFLPSATDPVTIGHHHVTGLLESKGGILWVGTDGGGLARIEPDTGGGWRVKRITTDDGLVNQNITSLLEDDDGTLWIATRHGLSHYDPGSSRFHNYGLGDGLPSVEFNPGAAWRGREGLYFGTSRGMLSIRPDTSFVEPSLSPTQITEIRNQAGPLRLSATPWEMATVEVPWGSPLSLAFTVLDFRSPHRFAYQLQGKSDTWVDLGASREISFSDLAPGDYTLRVRGRNAVGAWSQSKVPLGIRVKPPIWMTVWFRGALALCLLAAAFGVHHLRLSAVERRNRALLELQEQREKAREELHRAYERLRFLARRLEVAKEEERKHIARELHDDLGPSLTAVVINLELLRPTAMGEAARRIVDTVEIVDRMMQQIRELSLDLRPPLLDEMGLVPALKGYMETQAERSGLEIEVLANTPVEKLPAEVEIVAFRLAQEAVTNVIRHAGARRAVISIDVRGEWLEVSVQDDGKGFDVRSTMDEPATGKALGLLGMQERVGMLDGEFEIVSAPSVGTRVRARLPIGAGT